MISIKNVGRISSTRLGSFGYCDDYTTKLFLGSGVLVNCRHFLVRLYRSWMSTWREVERRIKCLRMLFSDAFVEGIFLSAKYLCSSLASTSTNTPSRFPLCMSYVGTSTTIRTIQGNCLRKSRSVVPKGPCLSHSTRLQKLKGPPLERSRTPIDARERERDRCSFEFARYSINAAKLFV